MSDYRISNWEDLQEFGFYALTGERCSLGLRLLVDLNEQAVMILKNCYDLVNITLRESHNHNCDSVASIMMDRQLSDSLVAFCLKSKQCEIMVKLTNGGFIGASGEHAERYRELHRKFWEGLQAYREQRENPEEAPSSYIDRIVELRGSYINVSDRI